MIFSRDQDWDRQRHLMIFNQLIKRDIGDERVLRVMGELARHEFIPAEHRDQAYQDQPALIGHGQTISQPYIVAYMTEVLGLTGSEMVLEIGTGCGYQTAILARLARKVYSIERIDELARQGQQNLARLNISNVEFYLGDGSKGWPEPLAERPGEEPRFEAILAAAAAERIPHGLVKQLGDNGRMVIPVGPAGDQKLMLVEKKENNITEKLLCYCRFVKLIED